MSKDNPSPSHVPGRAGNAYPSDLLTIAETADYLRISTKTLSKLIATGDLPARKVGNQYRISRRALEKYLTMGKTG